MKPTTRQQKALTTYKAAAAAILFAVAFFCTKAAKAQTALPLNVSYYGDFYLHPGLKVGTEYTLLTHYKEKQKKKRLKTKTRELLIAGSLIAYTHPGNHKALGLMPELVYRKTRESGWKKELLIGFGYQRRFNTGTTYTTDANGSVRRVPLASRGYFQPSVMMGFGKDLSVKGSAPLAWHLRTGFNVLTPYNAGNVVGLQCEAGITYKLSR